MDIVGALARAGAEIDAKDEDGWTPLHLAAAYGHVDIVRYLVENGANKDAA
eukprot:CAMPEP_0114129698 /NCGR_PEP_ID=MMETSP0043_2-20121206/11613_1 /TAXON_ID=464988 /ORGANISM="Hemiselmis andersenii, Strain CCMP644" /LENGTH=50 /DNA_ID=CAMNT_0001222989 /DNA_START=54 /DNA_END=203 /DNA_ORIENTATION=-